MTSSNPEKSRHLETASMRLGRYWIDFVNLRAGEHYAHNSRIPEYTRIGTAFEDAHRWDLTINSLFYNINEGTVEGRGHDREGIGRPPRGGHIHAPPASACCGRSDSRRDLVSSCPIR